MKRVVVISAVLYAFIKALKFSLGISPVIDSYATDLLCLPLVVNAAKGWSL